MKNKTIAAFVAAPLLMFALSVSSPAADTPATTCKDGTTSSSTGKGTCSGHGGIQKTPTANSPSAPATPAAAAPATAAPATAAPAAAAAPPAAAGPSAAAASVPTGATAKCKDGSYSKSQHRSGTCSSHGGVDTWLKAQ